MTELQTSDAQKAAAQIREWIDASQCAVAFTGAGISTESGIPDFRSPGGVWSKYRTVYFDEFCESAEARHEYWRQKAEAHREFEDAKPNVTHQTLALWEASGKLHGVVTQNIDGLHQQAGSKRVQQLHGTAREVSCLDCGWHDDNVDRWVKQFVESNQVPECPECGGRLKHATISFGQSLPPDSLDTALDWAKRSDLFLALGSSLVVEPAASLPRIAANSGAKLVIINRDETPIDGIAALTVRTTLGDVFKALNNK